MTGDEHQYLELAFLCDVASEKHGNLSALGIGINVIGAATLPNVATFTLVVRLSFIEPPGSGERNLEVRYLDPTGEVLGTIVGQFALATSADLDPDLPNGVNMIFPTQLPIHREGLHTVEITIDGRVYSPISFKVIIVESV